MPVFKLLLQAAYHRFQPEQPLVSLWLYPLAESSRCFSAHQSRAAFPVPGPVARMSDEVPQKEQATLYDTLSGWGQAAWGYASDSLNRCLLGCGPIESIGACLGRTVSGTGPRRVGHCSSPIPSTPSHHGRFANSCSALFLGSTRAGIRCIGALCIQSTRWHGPWAGWLGVGGRAQLRSVPAVRWLTG